MPLDLTTVEDAVEETRQHLYALHVPTYLTLSAAITASATSITFNEETVGINRGMFLSLGTELVLVLTIDHGTKTATVVRGRYGSDAQSHAAGDLVEANPRFPTWSILRALYRELQSWGAQVFVTDTVTIPGQTAVPVTAPADTLFVLDAREDDGTLPERNVRLTRMGGIPKVALVGGKVSSPVEVTVAVPPDVSTFDLSTSLVDTVGLTRSMLDIAPLGAAWRLTMPREVGRTFVRQQGQSRDAQEVPPGHILQTGAALKDMRDERLAEEGTGLRALFPYSIGS